MNIKILLNDINPPADLAAKVFARVESAIEQKNRNRKIIGFSLLFISAASLIDFIIYTINAFQKSGFSAYSSLIFSDSKLVLANFGQFMLSLVDSLPFFALTITLVSISVVLFSVWYLTNGKKELSYAF